MAEKRTYIAIDLKSFYASVECQERGLDPLTTNLVVADVSRTEKTICLAVSPSLKSYGISSRARLFEVVAAVKKINQERREAIRYEKFEGSSIDAGELKNNPRLSLDYLAAVPRMALYIEYSTRIYQIYLKYIAPEDIHVYSIDEVFIDVTGYLKTYGKTAREMAVMMIRDVLRTTGITAAAGIGENMFLAKAAMDIVAKHIPADENGVRIAELSEMDFRRYLWTHRPLTDFWRVGRGTARKLEANGMYTMGDVARCSIENEELLYKLFGVNAELLIDHSFGYEDTLISEIKAYRPEHSSISTGQVLSTAYSSQKARIVVQEMTDQMILDLVEHGLVTRQVVLAIGYDRISLEKNDDVETSSDWYGRTVPKSAHGSTSFKRSTDSYRTIMQAVMKLYDEITDPSLMVRRITMAACDVTDRSEAMNQVVYEQTNLFAPVEETADTHEEDEREYRAQQAILAIRRKFGRNSVLKGMSLEDGATAKERNEQIGGHKA